MRSRPKLQDQIETHNFKLKDIDNEAEENEDDEVDCDLEIKGIMDVEAQLNESEKNEDSNEKIRMVNQRSYLFKY